VPLPWATMSNSFGVRAARPQRDEDAETLEGVAPIWEAKAPTTLGVMEKRGSSAQNATGLPGGSLRSVLPARELPASQCPWLAQGIVTFLASGKQRT